jgi:zinc transporter, ZIP family
VLEATAWGLLGGSSLLLGAVLGLWVRLPRRLIGLVMGFGAGALISAVAFELTEEAFDLGGADSVALGLGAGAVTFFAADVFVERRGGGGRKRPPQARPEPGSGGALLAGALIDGIPESVVVGISLLEGPVSAAIVGAIFLSNMPEAIGGSVAMRSAGAARRHVLLAWGAVVVASALAAGLGYALLEGASDTAIALMNAFAAGAVLTMLVDEMVPAAYDHSGRPTGLVTVFGFALAYLLSTIG